MALPVIFFSFRAKVVCFMYVIKVLYLTVTTDQAGASVMNRVSHFCDRMCDEFQSILTWA